MNINNDTACPRSNDPFFIVTYYIKWVKTSLTGSIAMEKEGERGQTVHTTAIDRQTDKENKRHTLSSLWSFVKDVTKKSFIMKRRHSSINVNVSKQKKTHI